MKSRQYYNPLPSYSVNISFLASIYNIILLIPSLLYKKLFHILCRQNKIFFCFDSPIHQNECISIHQRIILGYMFCGGLLCDRHACCSLSIVMCVLQKFLVICRFVYVLIITVIHYGIITQNIFEVFFLLVCCCRSFLWSNETLDRDTECHSSCTNGVTSYFGLCYTFILEFWDM